MRYLKKFESNVDPLYTHISYEEYKDLFLGIIEWTPKEMFNLNQVFPTFYTALYNNDTGLAMSISERTKMRMAFDKNRVVIRKLPDDYYLVIYKELCYRCDQFDGLIQCIKDKIIED